MKKILLVDDDVDYAHGLRELLADKGYRVVVAFDGKRGLEMARQEKPDLMLLDIQMPGWDGGTVAQKAQEDKKLSRIPIIYLTSLIRPSEAMERRKSGASECFVAKTAGLKDLLAEIARSLEQPQVVESAQTPIHSGRKDNGIER